MKVRLVRPLTLFPYKSLKTRMALTLKHLLLWLSNCRKLLILGCSFTWCKLFILFMFVYDKNKDTPFCIGSMGTGDPHIETNPYPGSSGAFSSGFAPKRDKFLCGTCTCFKMVGMCPSMPDMFDGCRFLAETEMRGVRWSTISIYSRIVLRWTSSTV